MGLFNSFYPSDNEIKLCLWFASENNVPMQLSQTLVTQWKPLANPYLLLVTHLRVPFIPRFHAQILLADSASVCSLKIGVYLLSTCSNCPSFLTLKFVDFFTGKRKKKKKGKNCGNDSTSWKSNQEITQPLQHRLLQAIHPPVPGARGRQRAECATVVFSWSSNILISVTVFIT